MIFPGLKPTLEILTKTPDRIEKIYISRARHDPAIQKLLQTCQKLGIAVVAATAKELDDLCRKQHKVAHQGVVAILTPGKEISLPDLLAAAPAAPLPLILALDQVKDPGNLGSLARSAYALGCAGILIPGHNSANFSPAAIKSSAGTLAYLPLCAVTNLGRALDTAEENGFAIYGSGMAGQCEENPFAMQWQSPAIIVLGSEEGGIRPGIAKRCHAMLNIPLARHFDSLNVAQAGAMLMALYAANHWQTGNCL